MLYVCFRASTITGYKYLILKINFFFRLGKKVMNLANYSIPLVAPLIRLGDYLLQNMETIGYKSFPKEENLLGHLDREEKIRENLTNLVTLISQ